MARPLRLEHAGAFWHCTARGNEKQSIFHDDEDRWSFMAILGKVAKRLAWRVHALVLMGNHYHGLFETPEPNLAHGMRQLNGVYAQRFNRRHQRCGHLFQGRYDARLVQSDAYVVEVARYIALNPVRAGLVARPEDWPWSSFRATAGLETPPPWLDTDVILSHFAVEGLEPGQAFARFVLEGVGETLDIASLLTVQSTVGSARFLERTQERIDQDERSVEHPVRDRVVSRPRRSAVVEGVQRVFKVTNSDLRSPTCGEARKALALVCHEECLSTHREIGEVLGTRVSAVSRLLARGRTLLERDVGFRRRVARVRVLCQRDRG